MKELSSHTFNYAHKIQSFDFCWHSILSKSQLLCLRFDASYDCRMVDMKVNAFCDFVLLNLVSIIWCHTSKETESRICDAEANTTSSVDVYWTMKMGLDDAAARWVKLKEIGVALLSEMNVNVSDEDIEANLYKKILDAALNEDGKIVQAADEKYMKFKSAPYLSHRSCSCKELIHKHFHCRMEQWLIKTPLERLLENVSWRAL
ncbi:hypothetical protein Tco_0163581 [Tanacetum coccineum]